uniref:Nucleolar protein 11 N-terminal domain-containing protein n=1 Tax=Amblyomma triste TaxID=251400 RepID=A0A023GBI1_AMBTT
MTSIGEPFPLTTVTNEADSFRTFCVQPGPTDTSVVVTHGQLSASLLELEGRPFKLRTWNTSHAEPFTCPIVYDALRSRYVAASKSSLLILPQQDVNEAAATREKIALPNRVFAVLHRCSDEPLIVLNSGVCATLTELQALQKNDTTRSAKRVCEEQEGLVSVEAAPSNRDVSTTVILAIATTKEESALICRVFQFGATGSKLLSETSVSKSNAHAFCLFNGNLLSLDGDGSLGGRKLPLLNQDLAKTATLAAFDDTRVLVGLKDRMLVWNVRFGTLESSRTLEAQTAKRWGLVRTEACFVTGAGSNNVMCASVKLGRSTLCQAVGLGARVDGSVPTASALASQILAGDAEHLAEALSPVADTVSEQDLVSLLGRLFREGSAPPAGSAEMSVLHNVLRCPHTCTTLTRCLHNILSVEQATALIIYLLSLLENYSMADVEEMPLTKVMDWLACLLDAHFSHWALDTGPLAVGELLDRLAAAVSNIRELFSDLCEVEQWLLVILKKVDTLQFDSHSSYAIVPFEI